MKQDAFAGFHPAVNLGFFAAAIGLSMFLMHPAFLAVSALCGCMYLVYLSGGRGFLRQVGYLLPVMAVTALLNPLFNHRGDTVLFYLSGGNAVTLESVCFGLCSAVLMGATILWFNCCTAIFTTDKIIYLFGRIIPSLSLLLSMTLRFIPRFKSYLLSSIRVQRAMEAPKGRLGTLKQALTAFSATVSWAMEQSIVTADSMKSRGYGSGGRTTYSNYRFERRDGIALAVLGLCVCAAVLPWMLGLVRWEFFPGMTDGGLGFWPGLSWVCFCGVCLMPLIIDWKEERKWKSLRSKI